MERHPHGENSVRPPKKLKDHSVEKIAARLTVSPGRETLGWLLTQPRTDPH